MACFNDAISSIIAMSSGDQSAFAEGDGSRREAAF
jgi:hypothetical protein